MALAHFTLATRSVRKSSEFFQSIFGWEAINRPSNAPVPTGWLRITAGQEVHLVEIHDFERFFFKDPNGYVFEVMDENRDQFVSG